jgi:hypothetical protein
MCLFIGLFLSLGSIAQPGAQVFNDSILHELKIDIDLPNWFETLEQDFKLNLQDPKNNPEIYRKCNIIWDDDTIIGCGIREKGNSSNFLMPFGKKKPFKISFDEFGPYQLQGLKKINLNNFTNDPSLLHDVLSFKLMRDAGLVAPRTSYTKLYINDEYIGLYLTIENIDKTFLKYHYTSLNDDGNLYKTDRNASVFLNWLGNDSSQYIQKGLKLTTNEGQGNWKALIYFIDLINHNHSPKFKEAFEKVFDVHSYLKILAIEKCVRSWDNYWTGGNNFYLYEHPDGQIRWIPWDMNETFQYIKLFSTTAKLDGYLIPTNRFDERPLIKRIFEFEDYKAEYLNFVCDFIQTNYSVEALGKFILERHQLIDEAYKMDTYRYNSYESFSKSLTEDHLDEVSINRSAWVLRLRYQGVFPFIQSQRLWAIDQMKGWNHPCNVTINQLYNLNLFPNPAHNIVNILNEKEAFDYAKFEFYDVTGRLAMEKPFQFIPQNIVILEVENLKPGIYFILKKSANGKIGRAKVCIH